MNLSSFITIASVIDIILAHWEISLVAFIVFIILLVAVFRGLKRGIKLFLWIFSLACIGLGVAIAAVKAQKDPVGFISFALSWLPTISFAAAVLIHTLIGAWRGLRKSLILLTHAVCVAGLCIGLYFFCISSTKVDAWLLHVVNTFMGGGEALQNQLGVEGGTLKEVLIEYLPAAFGYGSEIKILFSGNYAYVMTLVDMIYRMAFAYFFCIVDVLLVFLLYIVYHIFYPERRYKKKKNLAFAQNKTDATYRKRRIGGGIIGFARGCIAGLISLSFLGSAFFIAAGGTGEKELADYKFSNKYADFGYTIYRSVESYGSQGIFKVLNSFKDPEGTPYYLFAADLIYSGGLDDEKNGINENIKMREELGAYIGFARDTMNLLMRYGEEELTPILNGESSSNTMSVIVDVMKKPEFQLEFDNLIDNFDSKTYFINFSLSLVNTVIANVDDMSFMSSVSEDNRELLKVLFKEGHLSSTIPDERALIAAGKSEVRPCFKLNHLLTKRDAQIAMRVALSLLSKESTLELIKKLLPEVEKLSIFSTNRKDEMDPVLGRTYCYLENKYLSDEGCDGVTYKEIKKANVAWGEEIRSLVSVAENLLALHENLGGGTITTTMLRSVFDETNPLYEQNLGLYDGVCAAVSDSVLLGKVLSSGYMMKQLTSIFKGVGENVYIPDTIDFDNKYDEAGNLTAHGETYQLFYGLRLLGEPENKELMDALFDSFKDMELSDILDMLEEAFAVKDKFGNTLSDYFTDSVLLRSAISALFIERSEENLIVPTGSREHDLFDLPVNLIQKQELKELFERLPLVNELISPMLNEESQTDVVTQFVKGRELFSVSGIVSASAVNYIVETDDLTTALNIPSAYLRAGAREKLEKYDKYNIWYDELPALITALDEIFEISAGEEAEINKDSTSEKMFGLLKTMNEASSVLADKTKLDVCYESAIIKNDLTIELDKALDDRVDASVIKAVKSGGYYKASEIQALSDAVNQLDVSSFKELENYDSSKINQLNQPSETHPSSTRLDVLYESVIAAGLVTSAVQDGIEGGKGVLIDHRSAYRSDVKVYKKNEIEALLSLLGENDVKDYKLSSVSALKPYVAPNVAGEPESYLVAAAVSKNLLDNKDLVIPASIVSEQLISALELSLLLDAYSAQNGDGLLDNWNVQNDMVLPAPDVRGRIVSSTIMRATMTYSIVDRNRTVTMAREHTAAENDCNGKAIAVICEEQMLVLFTILDVCQEDGANKLVIPKIASIQDIQKYADHISQLYAFDATRYDISKIVQGYAEDVQTEETYTLSVGGKISVNETTRGVVSLDEINEILAKYEA